jgi:integrase
MKGVCQKQGRLYFRRKIRGRDVYIRLPNLEDPNFGAAYQRASADETTRRRAGAGTIAALVADFRGSSEYRGLRSPRTKMNYSRYLDMLSVEHGQRSVTGIRPHYVRKMRDAMQDTPGKANNWLNVMKTLMAYAALNDWRTDNPARDVRMLPIGEHEPWPADVLERALAVASPMTRLALVTGLCSGARVGDVIRMQHGWHDGRIMEFQTSKNRTNVAVPMHPLWLSALTEMPRRAVTILYDRSGKPFRSTKPIQERIRTLMEEIGNPTYLSNGKERGFSFHGLRKNASCYLAELGLNDVEVGSICGMTPDTVRHYTKRARALMIARGAADRVLGGDVVPLNGGRLTSRAK